MSTPNTTNRTYDVVLFGATGFTGKLVAEELARRYGAGGELKWALAGRSKEKLEKIKDGLVAIDPRAKDLAIVIADASDAKALAEIARSTKVVCTTVGPYAVHGHPLASACAEAGTSYCDLTGETQFVRQSIDRNHARARETGARVVHCCGFDSIPSDLGVFLAQDAMKEHHGVRCREVKGFCGEMSGGFSGGTIASAMNIMKEAGKDPTIRRILVDPYALDPDRGERGPDRGDQRGVRFDADLGRWTGPFIMAAINTRVVRRTNAMLGYSWGKDFRYSECTSFGTGAKGWSTATAMTVGTGLFAGVLAFGPTRGLAKPLLPAPGEGPSEASRAHGHFTFRHVGLSEANGSGKASKVLVTVSDTMDPGYGSTAKMLSQSAVCLAKDTLDSKGGVLTPGSSMGMHLVKRLRNVGMTFEAKDA